MSVAPCISNQIFEKMIFVPLGKCTCASNSVCSHIFDPGRRGTKGVLTARSRIQSDVFVSCQFMLKRARHVCMLCFPFFCRSSTSHTFSLQDMCAKSNLFLEQFLTSIVTFQATFIRVAGVSARNTKGLEHGPIARGGVPSVGESHKLAHNNSMYCMQAQCTFGATWDSVPRLSLHYCFVQAKFKLMCAWKSGVSGRFTLLLCQDCVPTPAYLKYCTRAQCTVLFQKARVFSTAFDGECMLGSVYRNVLRNVQYTLILFQRSGPELSVHCWFRVSKMYTTHSC